MKVFLYVLFFLGGEPEPQLVNGWYPTEAPSMEQCASVAASMARALAEKPGPYDSVDIGCMEAKDIENLLYKLNEMYNGPTI